MGHSKELNQPFKRDEFIGWCRWDQLFTNRLREAGYGWAYSGCHTSTIRRSRGRGYIALGRSYDQCVGGTVETHNCRWFALDDVHKCYGSFFGPFVIQLPLRRLTGEYFDVYRRVVAGEPDVVYFVQLPCRPERRFDHRRVSAADQLRLRSDGKYTKDYSVRYQVLITQRMSLDKVLVKGCSHPRCRSGEHCDTGTIRGDLANAAMNAILGRDFKSVRPAKLRYLL